MTAIRTYSELVKLATFEERYEYLRISGSVGKATFGFDRYLNQILYTSQLWKSARDAVIIRDNGCDLALDEYPISWRLTVHHMNPITARDIENHLKTIVDPEFLVCVSHNTHEAIHYGDRSIINSLLHKRVPGDTTLWAKG